MVVILTQYCPSSLEGGGAVMSVSSEKVEGNGVPYLMHSRPPFRQNQNSQPISADK